MHLIFCRCCCWLQVASGFLIEVGKRDKLLFDLGTGAYVNLVATGVPQGEVAKVGPGRGLGQPCPMAVHEAFARLQPWFSHGHIWRSCTTVLSLALLSLPSPSTR